MNAGRNKGLRNITVAAANIKEDPGAMKSPHELDNYVIAMPEPERAVLDREARRIPVRWIGYSPTILPSEPKTGLALLKCRRQGCEIEFLNYRLLPGVNLADCHRPGELAQKIVSVTYIFRMTANVVNTRKPKLPISRFKMG